MNLLMEIFITATKILTLVFGFCGFLMSVLLLFHPDTIRKIGKMINSSISLVHLSPLLDRKIEANRLAYRHPFLIGSFFIIGSLYIFNFFFQSSFPATQTLPAAVLLESMLLLGKLTALTGLLLGLALIMFPNRIRALEDRLGKWIDTSSLFNTLDREFPYVDHIFLRYPLPSGAVSLLASFVLIILSVYNLMR